ncbi:MAG: hypothetical protein CUN49_13140 [Candidatus Thermofonsia Clade 1 bacterium]|jgi:hypothetical protein|uniref:Uncharacterized protein n=1 Tax=Candidatus Thermofonsia Clade 1 bacterium TaxID=2364210 RepID=A0A2M8PBK5_9CHLR|nr:MAG: hypothetical protein CUN49_13140 [Candidatus Thermofonsia Clade 1 bacterium]RMF52122.1 MAG: hypothetical protein D6749_05855 [Chloroflexota bacterium]
MAEWATWQQAYWRMLGILEGMLAQSERLYDHLPNGDRRTAECYDALIEALEALERQVRRQLNADDRYADLVLE